MFDYYENKSIFDSVFTEETASDLIHFIAGIYKKQADYKVMMARRMFNLSHVLLEFAEYAYLDQGIESAKNPFISNTALLCMGNKIAEYYCDNKRFPDVLICDDILVHGRGIMKLIRNLERVISNSLKKYEINVSEERIRQDLATAIKIYVICKNADGLLIDPIYKVYAVKTVQAGELRKLSGEISHFLQRCNVANTSFVLSAQMPFDSLLKLYDERIKYKTSNEDNSMLLYYRSRNKSVLETVRINYYSNNLERGCAVTSLVLFGDISLKSFNALCDRIASVLKNDNTQQFSCITSILTKSDDDNLIKPRAQLVSYLYSIISLFDFCEVREENNSRSLLQLLRSSDYEKVARNFDNTGFLRYEIYIFFKRLCDRAITSNLLWSCLDYKQIRIIDKNLPYSKSFSPGYYKTVSEREPPFDLSEDVFYSLGSTAEYDAVRSHSTGKGFKESFIGYDIISISEYLDYMSNHKTDDITSIGCVLYLMDSGLLSMNIEKIDREDTVQNIFKAGELATYVLPRRFSVFIPALSLVEAKYSFKGNSKESVISSFIDFLQENCYRSNDGENEQDRKLLNRLQESKPLLLSIYSMGQSFIDWNISLKDERLNASSQKKNDLDSTDLEQVLRERFYLRCAFDFLD